MSQPPSSCRGAGSSPLNPGWAGAEAELQNNVRFYCRLLEVLYAFIRADNVSNATCAHNSSEVSVLQILFYPGGATFKYLKQLPKGPGR